MIPELGHFSLILALCLAIVQTVFPLLGTFRAAPNWMAVARPAATGQFVFLVLAYACLTYAFIYNDFSVAYVASNSNSTLPLHYRIVSVWGGHEGSMLLWGLILSLWTVAVVIFSRSLPRPMAARVIAVMGFISIGFLLFMVLTSNPFDRLAFPPADGRDLNPLLQDPGLIIHPPMLYMGYVGFSVAFAFAIAALLGGSLDSAWARWSRPWTLIAWVFLTLGIALGSWWAYYELGWGGWWFWDPVENASFMPWLVGTALIHSLAVTEKRAAFKNWTVLLAISAFSLSLLGTFLVRSGVLTSVHAFASDPKRGIFILGFLGIVVGISLLLYAWRAPKVGKGGHFGLISKESFLLINNLLLLVTCASVLIGTLYPLFIDALKLGEISVGPPYFDKMFVLFMFPLVLLLGVGPLVRWKQDKISNLAGLLAVSFILSIIAGVAIPYLFVGMKGLVIMPGVALAIWVMLTGMRTFMDKLKHKNNPIQAAFQLPTSFYGMGIAHFGVAIFVIGITLTQSFSVERDVRMALNEAVDVGGYHFTLKEIKPFDGPNYRADKALIVVEKEGEVIAELRPEKRMYLVQQMPMTEAAINVTVFRDLYVALGEPVGSNAWAVRVYFKPFIRWIWFGALLMALGGTMAAMDKRYRKRTLLAQKNMATAAS
ncbi:MAG: heme lyase CcmF/NrfE family subunit [Thiotrichaceae bacterium]|nr:heme lyase CcmF/NrfE family subunit [Thiotrichaceae bacterium]